MTPQQVAALLSEAFDESAIIVGKVFSESSGILRWNSFIFSHWSGRILSKSLL
ncbi:hypothetical protein LEP1GSC013_3523 [Leptospira interrogans serovar Valbuzzi str. Duyster]|nr:hypothetical protein LEP1GSC013_1004 [Leptospira interrogans serovar Valbuzzi str. Duyster]EMJ53662.1 hypothetical protein LEP1GSC013_1743 [Leptospira interrogans serovar Valbuzzi str. Duyster]EMJ54762.1 hypothetical protein LEP1GSC013_2494 [Leptospira interrogans serovar Valbuzzi str. Duyster]EMJ54786.1 hypothetical protein LEP1GSC013_2541 [Leptospira interrogans serovar Valbuzzi str. Duyster]EMJ55383.1 hypothetical protein LEP1GSC013_1890 [Leptospira interrogans serovar Valbuzzi str. Duyst